MEKPKTEEIERLVEIKKRQDFKINCPLCQGHFELV